MSIKAANRYFLCLVISYLVSSVIFGTYIEYYHMPNDFLLLMSGTYLVMALVSAITCLITKENPFLRFKRIDAVFLPYLIILFVAIRLVMDSAEILSMCFNYTGKQETYAIYLQYSPVAGILFLSIIPAVLEEFFFRGIIYNSYRREANFLYAAACSSLIFGLVHMDVWQLPGTVAAGFLFAAAYEVTGTLLAPIILHCFSNLAEGLQLYVPFLHKLDVKRDLMVFNLVNGSTDIYDIALIFFIFIELAAGILILLWLKKKIWKEEEGIPTTKENAADCLTFSMAAGTAITIMIALISL